MVVAGRMDVLLSAPTPGGALVEDASVRADPCRCRRESLGYMSGRKTHPYELRPMSDDTALRQQLARGIDWQEAHASFDTAVADFPAELRGVVPAGLPYSGWQLVEHIRRTQADILEFCVGAHYEEKMWPKDYWPQAAAPPSHKAWEESIEAVRRDRAALATMTTTTKTNLTAPVPNGDGQTYLREILLVIDHTAYHVGELVVLRRLLGAWPAS